MLYRIATLYLKFEDPTICDLCNEGGAVYQTSNQLTMRLHVALAHSRLEELLADAAIVSAKRRAIKSKPVTTKTENGSILIQR